MDKPIVLPRMKKGEPGTKTLCIVLTAGLMQRFKVYVAQQSRSMSGVLTEYIEKLTVDATLKNVQVYGSARIQKSQGLNVEGIKVTDFPPLGVPPAEPPK